MGVGGSSTSCARDFKPFRRAQGNEPGHQDLPTAGTVLTAATSALRPRLRHRTTTTSIGIGDFANLEGDADGETCESLPTY